MGTLSRLDKMLIPLGLITYEHHQVECRELKHFRGKAESMMILADCLKDQLAAKELELDSLKKKIVERAQVTPIIKAKSAAEIRRVVEQENEREFEEQNAAG